MSSSIRLSICPRTPITENTSPRSTHLTEDAFQALFKESVRDYSLSEIWYLEGTLQWLRNAEGNKSERYIRLKSLVHNVRMTHLPLRSYMMWKNGTEEFRSDFFVGKRSEIKEHRKDVKGDLQRISSTGISEERLNLLSRLTFIHGTSSSTLAMMLIMEDPALLWTGELLKRNIAPMYGELSSGVDPWGINLTELSTETIRDINRIVGYTKLSPFNENKFEYLRNPYRGLHMSSPEQLRDLILALAKWKEEAPARYASIFFAPYENNPTKFLIREAVCQTIANAHDCSYQTPYADRLRRVLPHLNTFLYQLDCGIEFTGLPANENQKFYVEKNLKILQNPYSVFSNEMSWNSKAIDLLQMKQWDRKIFDATVVPMRQEWQACIDAERSEQSKPLHLLNAICTHPFTADEIVFIRNHWRDVGGSDGAVPESLQDLFPTRCTIPKAPDWLCNVGCESLQHEIAQYRSGQSPWKTLTGMILMVKMQGKDLSRQKLIFDDELNRIETGYRHITTALSDAPMSVAIPEDETLRSLFTQPVPIIFSSTTVKPKPCSPDENPNEYILDTPTRLGKGGCDLLFTDSLESIERIKAVLPAALKEEIEIYTFEMLDAGVLPLIHSTTQVLKV